MMALLATRSEVERIPWVETLRKEFIRSLPLFWVPLNAMYIDAYLLASFD